MTQLRQLIGDRLTWAVVAEERHEDGAPHLHAVLRFDRLFDRRHSRWADLTKADDTAVHGNYAPCRNVKDSVKYILKDGNYCVWPEDLDIAQITTQGKKRPISTVVADMIVDGKGYDDIVAEHPGFAMMNKQKIESFQQYIHAKKARGLIVPWVPITDAQIDALNFGEQLVARWLNDNLGVNRKFKDKQLWLSGGASLGKTSLAIELARCQLTFEVGNEKYIQGYDDDCDLIVFEEVANQHTLTFLNRFIQGGIPMPIPVKGGSTMKNKNQPVMFLSNMPPEQAFPKASSGASFAAFLVRIEVIHINQHLFDLINIIKANNDAYEAATGGISQLAEAAANAAQAEAAAAIAAPQLLPSVLLNALEGDEEDDDAEEEPVAAGIGNRVWDHTESGADIWAPGDFDDIDFDALNSLLRRT